MKTSAYSNVAQYSDVTTELNKAIDDFVLALDKIAVSIAEVFNNSLDVRDYGDDIQKRTASISSRLISISSRVDHIEERIVSARDSLNFVRNTVNSGVLLDFLDYEDSRNSIDASSKYVETHMNMAANNVSRGSPYKEAYYKMTGVSDAFAGLVKEFNSVILIYNKLHNTTLNGAKTSYTFFKGKSDVQ